jgi:homoserine O-acetyltransferase
VPGAHDGVLELGDLELELGGTLAGARLAYRTHGALSPERDNAILFPHMYSGSPASLDPWVESGRPLDPDRWFVVCPAQLVGGKLTIGDDVTVQRRLASSLGIERFELVLGFSMGAQQAYEWAVRFPGMVRRLAAFAGTARTTPLNGLIVAASEEALRSGGLGQHARYWVGTALSAELFRRESWREAGFTSVGDMVRRLFEEDFEPQDPESLLAQLGKWRRADVSRHAAGDLAAALGRISARTFVVPFSHDALFPVADCEAEQRLIRGSDLRVVESVWGHYAWGMTAAETEQIDAILADLLSEA